MDVGSPIQSAAYSPPVSPRLGGPSLPRIEWAESPTATERRAGGPACPLSNRPILVTGSHRSGTTWVGSMIASHPGIAYLDEPFNCYDAVGVPTRHFFRHVTAADEDQFRWYLEGLLRFRTAPRLRANESGFWNGCWRLPRAALGALRLLRRRIRGRRPLVKDPIAFFSAGWLAATFGMDVVVLIRHPAAFASSLKRLNWGFDFNELRSQPVLMQSYLAAFHDEIERFARRPPGIIDQATLLWRVFHAVIRRYQAAHPEWVFARHEDLSRRPVGEFGRLLWRLGLRMTGHVRRTIEEHTSPDNPREAAEGVTHKLRRDSEANVWSWKYRLSPAEVARVRRGTEDVAGFFYSDEDW